MKNIIVSFLLEYKNDKFFCYQINEFEKILHNEKYKIIDMKVLFIDNLDYACKFDE